MHVEQSLKSIKWDDFEPVPVRGERTAATIASAREFSIQRLPLAAGASVVFAAGEQPRILSVVEGRLVAPTGEVLVRGDNVILPYSVKNEFIAENDALVLVTGNFC